MRLVLNYGLVLNTINKLHPVLQTPGRDASHVAIHTAPSMIKIGIILSDEDLAFCYYQWPSFESLPLFISSDT